MFGSVSTRLLLSPLRSCSLRRSAAHAISRSSARRSMVPDAARLADATIVVRDGRIERVGHVRRRAHSRRYADDRRPRHNGRRRLLEQPHPPAHARRPRCSIAAGGDAGSRAATDADALGLHRCVRGGWLTGQCDRIASTDRARGTARPPAAHDGRAVLSAKTARRSTSESSMPITAGRVPKRQRPSKARQRARAQLAAGADGVKLFTGAIVGGPTDVLPMDIAVAEVIVAEAKARGSPPSRIRATFAASRSR